ncbi:MAG TPA: NAD(P)-dependent oxidoreductase [Actinocrinis sp.]|nr:NAD(P)-dependent oxidoreductase [Actinocrinis sp.]
MRIALAGATGVIGRALSPVLREHGHQVTALVRDPERAADQARTGIWDDVVVADALDPLAVRDAIVTARPDAVVHQLSALRGNTPDAVERTARLRTEGTANLITAARAAGVRRLVVQSIAFAAAPVGAPVVDEDAPLYLDAPDPGWAQTVGAVAELERLVSGVRDIAGVVLRYGTLYGPATHYDPAGPFADTVARGRFPLPGTGAGITSFLHVDDAASAALAALESTVTGVFHITDDEPAAAGIWLPAYARHVGGPVPRPVPEAMAERLLGWFTAHQMTDRRGADNARARQLLGWKPARTSWRQEWTGA